MLKNSLLLSIDQKKIKYGLTRTKQLLKACNDPQKQILSIQVVGTNGKGSTAAMLANVLINNNYKTGLFTSPHLVHINERIRINHTNIPNHVINNFLNKYKHAIKTIKPSFFEIMTVLSLYYFAREKTNITILETGLGGALDSVTAAKSNILVFTPIDYDHVSILGNSLKEIAKQKAGAINNSKQILISCKQRHTVQNVLNKMALKKNNAILYQKKCSLAFSSLLMQHQCNNAKLAAYTLQHLQTSHPFQLKGIERYIENTKWPGRIQTIQKTPDVIFDVAHNRQSIRAFIKYFQKVRKHYKKAFLIIGFEDKKKIKQELPHLYQCFNYIDFTETQIRKSMSAELLFNLCPPKHSSVTINKNPLKIIKQRIKQLDAKDVLIILGSHYFGPYLQKIYKNCFDIQKNDINLSV